MREILPGVLKKGKFLIVDDDVYVREATDRVRVKAFDLGNGQMELVGSRVYEYRQVDELDYGHAPHPEYFLGDEAEPTAAELAERAAKSREKAAKRATANVRRLCKVMGANTLLTLTYRANQEDLALCKKHLKEFIRRVYRVLPNFQAVAAFERQDRGAWHVHLATERIPADLERQGVKVKSFNLLRAIWRAVVGDLSGNVDVSAGKRNRQRSASRIAAYISKYISKAFIEGDAFVNRWTKFGDCKVPKSVLLGEFADELMAMRAAFDLLEVDHAVENLYRSKWGDFFFLVVEKPGKPRIN